MRVLQVARYGSLRGGAETYVASLFEGLRAAGHTVALAYGFEPDPSRPEVRDGFEIPGLADPGALNAAIDAFEPDLVHVHTPDVPWVAQAAAARAPTLLAVHDHKLNCPVGTKYWAGWKRACTVHPGPWCLGYNAAAHCGSMRANVTLRPYRTWREARAAASPLPIQVFSDFMRGQLARAGIDGAGVTHYPVPPAAEPRAPALADRRPVVLASGRLNKEKGFHQLIMAMDRIGVPCHLLIAGEGHERPALERRARSAGGGHRITFAGWLSQSELAGWRAQASVVAVPSMWPEPFGIVGLEAMAAGVPVVAFDSGGIREWLADGETGVLVRAGDALGLARALGDLLRDEATRERMGAEARARAARDFSLEGHVRALEDLYAKARAR